jgi:uncharacterized protein (TIGR00369 family)
MTTGIARPTAFDGVMPLTRTLGIDLVETTPQLVRARLDWSESLCTTGGALHGGMIMTLADSAGALCAFLNLPPAAAGTTTMNSTTAFLSAVRSGTVEAAARPMKVGRTAILVEVDVTNTGGRPVSRSTQTQLILWEKHKQRSTDADA